MRACVLAGCVENYATSRCLLNHTFIDIKSLIQQGWKAFRKIGCDEHGSDAPRNEERGCDSSVTYVHTMSQSEEEKHALIGYGAA